jgi:hypothetical protein
VSRTNGMLDTMSLVELKRLAKAKKIKHYYIMKRADLIELLGMNEIPFEYRLQKMTIAELRSVAKERGLRGFWNLSKDKLSALLFPKNEKQDDSETREHQDPQNKDTDEVRVQTPKHTFE